MSREGIYYDLGESEYHADPDSLSCSGAKVLLRSPALFRHQQQHGRPDTAAFDHGHAAHALVLGVGSPLRLVDAEDWRTKAAQAERAAAREAGEVPLLARDRAVVQAMADRLSEHTLAMRLLSQGAPEVSAFAPDETTGVMRRARFDWLAEHVITDYKTTSSARPDDLAGRYGTVAKYGYDQQAAWYLDVARDLGCDIQEFAFLFQEKQAPHEVTVATIHPDELDVARGRNAAALALYADCIETGHWPGYTAADEAVVLSVSDRTYERETIA